MGRMKKVVASAILFAMVLGVIGIMPEMPVKAANNVAVMYDGSEVLTEGNKVPLGTTLSAKVRYGSSTGTDISDEHIFEWFVKKTGSPEFATIGIIGQSYVPLGADMVGAEVKFVAVEKSSGAKLTSPTIIITKGAAADLAIDDIEFSSAASELRIKVKETNTGNLYTSPYYIYMWELSPSNPDRVKNGGVYEAYPDAEGIVAIDLSDYLKKGIILKIHAGDEELAETVVINKNPDKLKVIVEDLSKKDILAGLKVTLNGAVITDYSNLQFRIDGNTWMNAADATGKAASDELRLAISKMTYFGGMVYFRQSGTDEKGDYVFSTAETKLKFPKAGKSPKLAIDYVKNIVKFPKNVEVKGIYVDKEKAVVDEWVVYDKSGSSIDIEGLLGLNSEAVFDAFKFYVRTAANGKKPSSIILEVSMAKVEEFDTSKIIFGTDSRGNTVFTNKTGVDVEYMIADKWIKVAKEGSSKALGTASDIKVRSMGVKEDSKNKISSKRPSQPVVVLVSLPSEEESEEPN